MLHNWPLRIKPVDELKTSNRLKIDRIVCDKCQVVNKSGRSDHGVHVGHRLASVQHLSSQFTKSQGDLKIDFNDIQ